MLPSKTYYKTECRLYESNFDTSGALSVHRVAEFLQDAAGEHAKQLGFGWDNLDATGCLWVLSKLRIRFDKRISKQTKRFTLYTWPLRPARFFAERCFVALDDAGEQLFAATSIWLVIDRESRRIVSSERLKIIYDCDFDEAHCDVPADFERIRRDETYLCCYEKTIRRSDLDVNGHVNNTNYINFALDALDPDEAVSQLEIVYQKELRFGDSALIYRKRQDNCVFVVGERDETCFTAKLTLTDNA